MEKEGGVKAAAEGEIVAAPGVPVACFKKTAGEEAEATFMERVKDYYNQFKENSAEKHWICFKDKFRASGDYFSQKSSSVFGKKKVEPVVKDEEAGPVAVDSQLKMESSKTQPQGSASSVPKKPAMTSCRKKKSDDATFLEDLKDHMDEFIHASMDEHKTCFKNTIQKMFGMSKVVAERSAEAKEAEVESALPLQTSVSH
ncbi:hypothetical protein E2562_001542 [Oryza meyeriana var. granulata]|uniref:Uncharacterized protein n=1 Tax=Oryza meyeriana var. granulata TaxID=110450 RepID=A0A6G1DDW3_9ORYZ|nr:hypothetical protein E2562_001542 [Oryza meyeriana var. granulata]